MDRFSYYNIFESKGIEYLAIIAFFAILIPFWIILNRQRKIIKQISKGLGFLSANVLKIPQGIFYCKNHTWAYLEKNGTARVGLDDLLLHITGAVQIKNLRNPGEKIDKGDLLAELNQNGKKLLILSPISGEILDQNTLLHETPEVLNEDPYEKGWVYKIKPSQWIAETSSYYLAEEAVTWSKKEVERLKDFLAVSMRNYSPEPSAVILQDGGEIYDNALAEMPKEVWCDFQSDFLKIS